VDRFDVIIIGMGPGEEAAAGRLLQAGRRVAVLERELIGGDCAYWACIMRGQHSGNGEAGVHASRRWQ
jgi:dihydrolipoamide dehydrogenase